MQSHRPLPSFFFPLLLLLGVSLSAAAQDSKSTAQTENRWYVMLVEGKPSGWMNESVVTSPLKEITSISRSKLSMKRGAVTMVIENESRFKETHDGKPISVETFATTGSMQVKQTMTFKENEIEIVSVQGKQTTRSSAPLPKEPWLTPAAAGRYVLEQLKKDSKEITFTTMEPSTDLQPLKIKMKVIGKEDIEVLGKVVPSIEVETTFSNLPGITSKQYIDDQGRMLKMTLTPMPGFAITALLADEALAMAQVDPPEVLASTLIEMKTPIKDARSLKSAVFELTFKPSPQDKADHKVAVPDLPKVGFQRVVFGDDRTARVIVDLSEPVAPGDDLPKKEHRTASAVLNSDDPKIKELVETALKKQPANLSDLDKAQVLREFVYRYIRKKDLSVGFAHASEVARTRQGDCTEHGVLLAAMLRAAGIPSRTVSGLIYIDFFEGKRNVFGYHMWAQAWIQSEKTGGHWVDVDATLPSPGFDAAHITLSVSAMADGASNDMVQLVPIIGRLDIKVIQTKSTK